MLGAPGLALDPLRVYLVGVSMGGTGAWDIAARYPSRFAAVVSVSGEGPQSVSFDTAAAALRAMPLWVFHAENDIVCNITKIDGASVRGAGLCLRPSARPSVRGAEDRARGPTSQTITSASAPRLRTHPPFASLLTDC